jgi:hypothetical protein
MTDLAVGVRRVRLSYSLSGREERRSSPWPLRRDDHAVMEVYGACGEKTLYGKKVGRGDPLDLSGR